VSGSLAGRVAIVTGAAQGIGAATAERLRAAGAEVIGFDLRGSDVTCDVGDFAALRAAIDHVAATAGRLDVLVNNAGRGSHTLPHELEVEEFEAVLSTNVGGYFFAAQAAFPHLRATRGCIVNISSTAATSVLGRGNFAYSISKAAIEQMTRELAVEWATTAVRVNAVAPCQVRTPGFQALLGDPRLDEGHLGVRVLAGIPLGRLAEPDDVAAAVHFLVSEDASFVTGSVLAVDGGNLALNAGGTPGDLPAVTR
jgi:NAD(P)-dependent dehydrogenase (short-subunit alcohol dehydrogenase family)